MFSEGNTFIYVNNKKTVSINGEFCLVIGHRNNVKRTELSTTATRYTPVPDL